MKKNILILIVVLMLYICAEASDIIPVFLKIYVNGKESGEVLFWEIIVFKEKEEIKWYLNEISFLENNLDKAISIDIIHSRLKDDYRLPLLTEVKWIPGKRFECVYDDFMNIVAEKVSEKKYDWKLYGKGKYRMPPEDPNGKENIMEFKSIKEIKLKYKRLRMVNLYYK